MFEQFPFITEGIVKDTDDPQQNGRVKVWCPALDGEDFDATLLPWAEYASPLAGTTNDYATGRNSTKSEGPVAYGFWAIPKVGSQVLVFLLNGDPNRRVYFAGMFGLHRNRSLPTGRNDSENGAPGPFTDVYSPLQPAFDNLRVAFQNQMSSPQARTRGWQERQVAQDQTEKDGKEGYATNPVDGKYLDPQTYCLVTPGHHVFLMDDAADNCRIRLKSCEGNQVIIDDSNERIYISTAKGKTWIELDEDGHIHVFGSQSISMRAGKDVNIYADRDFNVEAGRNVNLKAVNGQAMMTAKKDINIRSSTGSILQTACDEFHICSTNGYFLSAKEINNTAETSILHTAEGGGVHLKSTGDMNFDSSASLNQKAGSSINIKSSQGAGMSFGGDTTMVAGNVKMKASSMEIDAGSNLTMGAQQIDSFSSGGSGKPYAPFSSASGINPSHASSATNSTCAEDASSPTIVPGHEPWKRPASEKARNKHWRE